VSAPAANQQRNNQVKNKMKKLNEELGLAAEASEDAQLDAVIKLKNRVTELAPLADENTQLKNRITAADGSAVDSLLAAHGVKDQKVLNRLKPVLLGMDKQEDRVAALADFGFKPVEAGKPTTRVLNRGTGKPEETESVEGQDGQAVAEKIKNRANELKGSAPGRTFDSCWRQATNELKVKS
jgi:hypothetical protein